MKVQFLPPLKIVTTPLLTVKIFSPRQPLIYIIYSMNPHLFHSDLQVAWKLSTAILHMDTNYLTVFNLLSPLSEHFSTGVVTDYTENVIGVFVNATRPKTLRQKPRLD